MTPAVTPACPNCSAPMTAQVVETHEALRPVEINACAACSLFWFDKSESVRLAPRAVLGLFELIGRSGGARNAMSAKPACPRCTRSLEPAQDLQRTTRFSYWRCPNDHGRLVTFHQFLREKNFIRAPSPAELAKLRSAVRQISCSQCGAPVDLATDSACRHCGAPVALIDPDGVAQALADLDRAAASPVAPRPDAVRAALSEAQVSAIFDSERTRRREGSDDLVAIGAAAIAALVAVLLRSI